jgi:TP901 family phage tail tape measure protein
VPPIRLQIEVSETGAPIVDKLAASVQKLGPAAQQASGGVQQLGTATDQLSQQTGKADGSFLSSAKSALGFAGALTGIQLGMSGVGQILQSTASAVLGFQSALANVNTLGSNSVEVQRQLRDQLLLLPPALGSSVDLAKGLYDVLSAGIPAVESVKFLAVSANLAKAGLAEVGTTTEALTKTMAAFNIPTKDAGQLADVLFKVVDLGQGTLQQFAHAFPQVTQGAAALGLSFVDTAAAMATLTQTFRSADTAGTGFRSLLVQLVQNSDKFAQSGINIQQVLGEQGIVGVLKVLQDLTGGNTEKMKVFVNDIEGLNAALALSGPQFQLLLENQGKLGDSTGVVAAGVKLQTETFSASFSALTNAFTTYVTAATTGSKETSLFQSVLAAFTKGFQEHTAAVVESGKREEAYAADQARLRLGQDQVKISVDDATKSFQFLGNTYQNTQKYVASYDQAAAKAAATLEAKIVATEKEIAVLKIEADAHTAGFNSNEALATSLTLSTLRLTEQDKALRDLETDLKTLNANVKAFKPGDFAVIDVVKAERDVQATIAAILRIGETGKVNFGELLKRAEGMTQGIRETFGTLPPTWQQTLDYLNDRARTELPKIGALFEKLGLQSKEALQQTATETGKDLDALLTTTQKKTTDSVELVRDASGKLLIQQKATVDGVSQQISQSVTATNASLLAEFHKTVDAINKGEFQRIPDDLRASLDKLAPIAQKATGEVATITHDAFGNVVVSLEKVGTAATHAGEALARSGQEAEAAAANYRRATGATDGLENSLQGLSAAAIASGHSLNAAGIEVNKYGNEIVKTLSNAEKLGQLIGTTAFATDKAGLLTQLQTATRELQRVREQGEIEGTQGGRAFTINALSQEIAAITAKLQGLGVVVDDLTQNPLDALKRSATENAASLTKLTTTVQATTASSAGGTRSSSSVGARFVASSPADVDPTTGLTRGYGGFGDYTQGVPDASLTQPVLGAGAAVITGPQGATAPLASLSARASSASTGSSASLTTGGSGGPLGVVGIPVVGTTTAIDPVTRRPYAPGVGSLAPGRGSVRGFAQGGLVEGPGGADSVLARLTPGERVLTPAQDAQRNQSPPGITNHIQVTLTLNVTAPIDRITAQRLVTEIEPALNEAIRRGSIRVAA